MVKLREVPTKVIAEATGYNPRTVRRLNRWEFRPSEEWLARLLTIAKAPNDGTP